MKLMPAYALTPATWPWLLRHELRLAWRHVGGKARFWFLVIGGGLLWLALHLAAWGILKGWAIAGEAGVQVPPMATIIFGVIIWFVMSLMLSQAIMLSVRALFERGDFDLLLASPMSARTVFMVRGLGIATSTLLFYLFLFAPLAHVGLFLGHAHLLAIYPALISLALLVSSMGMLLTLTLVRMMGARRARVVAQLIGAAVGAIMFILSQAQAVLGSNARAMISATIKRWIETDGPLAPDSVIWFPFRAMLGEWLPLLVIVAIGAGGFWLVVNLTYQRFLSGTQESVTGTAKIKPASAVSGGMKFRSGLMRNVLVKEWKLIARDPNLIAQTLLQILYLLPLFFLLFRKSDVSTLVVPSSVMLSCTLAGSLAWLTIAAEDAPELVGVAPVSLAHIRGLKALAAVIPVWLLVSPILFYLLATNIIHALVFLLCIIGGTLTVGLMHTWYPRKGDRKNMKKRGQGNVLVNLAELLSALGWAGMAFALLTIPWFAPLGLFLAAIGPLFAWFTGAARRDQILLA